MCCVTPREILERIATEYRAELAAEEAARKASEPKPNAGSHPRARGPFTVGGDNRVKRCRAYLGTLPTSVEGQKGSDRVFHAARVIWNDFGIDEGDGYPLLEEYNRRADPPWDEDGSQGLRRKWDEAVKKGPCERGRGWKLKEDRPGWNSSRNGKHDGSATSDPPDSVSPNDAPNNPHRLAIGYLDSVSPPDAPRLLRFWRDEFFRYREGAYRSVSDGDLRACLTQYVRAEFVRLNEAVSAMLDEEADGPDGDDTKKKEKKPPAVIPVTTRLVSDVLQALRGESLLPADVETPVWIEGATGPDPTGLIPLRNGILDLVALADGQTGYLLPPSPQFFSTTVAPFIFDPSAPAPREWLKFLRELWPDDPESIAALQEWFGLLLTPDTRYQKILFLLGPKRGGKGTILRVLRELVGPANVAGPTLGSLALNFGLWPLLGKSVAAISDARLSGRTDASVVTERLLSISGEDALTVDRKFREPLTVKLNTRVVILSNELPRLSDASGALSGRFILLRLTRSWFNKEDHLLLDRLLIELPGILLWAIEGWRRLRQRGRLVQPASGAELIQEMDDLSSPVGAFVRDRCVISPGERVEVNELYREWRAWCDQHGRKEPGTEETFGRDLRAAVPSVGKARPRTEAGRAYFYTGLRVRGIADPETPHDGRGDHMDQPSESPESGPSGPCGRSDQPFDAMPENECSLPAESVFGSKEASAEPVRDQMPGRYDHMDHSDQGGTEEMFI